LANLDPANDVSIPYRCDIDLADLIRLEDVCEDDELKLGPNGGLVYCMEYLLENVEWLIERIIEKDTRYIVLDCPGQIELYVHYDTMRRVCGALEKRNIRLTCVHLSDSTACSDVSRFIASSAVTLSGMMNMEMPTVNVLSKIDLLRAMGGPVLPLELFTECSDTDAFRSYLSHRNKDDNKHHSSRHLSRLHNALIDLIEDSSLLSFVPLLLHSKESMALLVSIIDKANGYDYMTEGRSAVDVAIFQALGAGNNEYAYNLNQTVLDDHSGEEEAGNFLVNDPRVKKMTLSNGAIAIREHGWSVASDPSPSQ
jgi:GPN-loop GTPase